MKKILSLLIILSILFSLCAPVGIYAHTGVDDFFDFENYVGDDATMKAIPSKGDGGYWGSYLPDHSTYGGGITSATSDGNTSVKVVQGTGGGNAYNRILGYYPNVPMASSIHFEYSTMLDSTASSRSISFILYDNSDSSTSVQTIMSFNGANNIYAFTDTKLGTWTANRWYDVAIDYNIISGFFKVSVYDRTADNYMTASGTKLYNDSSNTYGSISRIRFGYGGGSGATTYYDNVRIQTVNRLYDKEYYDFEDSVINADSTTLTLKDNTVLKLQNLYALSDGKYAVIETAETDKGDSIAYRTNTKKGLSVYKDGLSLAGTVEVSCSVKLFDYGSQRRIQLANTSAKQYAQILKIANNTGKVTFCNVETDIILSTEMWYDIRIICNMDNTCAKLIISDENGNVYTSSQTWSSSDSWYASLSTVNNLIFDLGYATITEGKLTETYLDDVSIFETEPFYVPSDSADYPFDIADSDPYTASPDVAPSDSFTVVFTNPVSADTLLPQNVLINGAASLSQSDITFVDDYTVKFKYQLAENTDYHIVFNNISNTSGDTLTDFIEFSTRPAAVECSNISFTKLYNGEKVALGAVSAGDITVSAEVWANGGKNPDILYLTALYNADGSELLDVKVTEITATSQPANLEHTFTVAQGDESSRSIKVFVWNEADLQPYKTAVLSAAGNGPVVLLKLDDVRGKNDSTSYNNFDKIYDYAAEENVPMAFGVIGNSLESNDQDYYDTLKKWNDSGLIEVWHHGYWHSYFDADGNAWTEDSGSKYGEYKLSYEKQYESFSATYNLLKEKAGIEIRSFCAPFNATDDTTVTMLNNDFPQIKVMMTALDPVSLPQYTTEPQFMHLTNRIHVESATGVFSDFDTFKAEFTEKLNDDYIVIQMHGGLWWEINSTRTEEQFSRFKEMVEFMRQSGATFMTPYSYYLETTSETNNS